MFWMPGSLTRPCQDAVSRSPGPGSAGRAGTGSRKGCLMRMARPVPLVLVRRATLFLSVVAALISVGVAAPPPASAISFVKVYNATDTGLCISHDTWEPEQLFEDVCSGPAAISWDVPGDGSFHEWLRGVDQHLCLTAVGSAGAVNGNPVYQISCDYSPGPALDQQWDVINGGQLLNRLTGLCLAVLLPQQVRAPLIQWNCNNKTPGQFWHW